ASATIEIGKENRTMVGPGGVVIQSDDEDNYYVTTGMNTKIRLIQSRPLLEDVVVALKLDQNPLFLDITRQKAVWESLKPISGKVQSPNAEPSAPRAIATNVPVPENAGERSPEEKARLAPYVDVLAGNLTASQLPDTRMLVISYTHTDPALAATVANA